MKKTFTTNFEKKLARYSAVAGTMAVASTAGAQVVYYDINPDIVISNSTMVFDLNGDTQADFAVRDTNRVQVSGSTTYNIWSALVFPIGNNAVAADGTSYLYPFKLASGAPINSTLSWISNSAAGSLAFNVDSSFPFSGSHWQGDATDGYLALKFDVAGQAVYGWLRISVAANTQSITLKDLGFNATPNTAINAGEMPAVGVPELTDKVRVFENNNTLNIIMNEALTNGNMTIVSMAGQVVVDKTITGSETVDLNGFAAGIYTVNIQSEEGFLVTKVMIK